MGSSGVSTWEWEVSWLGGVRTSTILQMEAAECGAAALAIVFAYYRVFLSLERLRDECGVSRDGTNAARLVEVARRYGFEASGFRKEPEELGALPLPAIIHWKFDHFVVLEKIGRAEAWINDPARGRRRVTRVEFDRSFTGPILVFRPGAGFRPQGAAPRLLPRLLEWLSGSRLALLYLTLVGLFLVIPGVVVPALSRVFVDQVLAGQRSELALPLTGGMVLTAFCRGLLTWMQREALARLSCRLVVELSTKYLWQAVRLPLSFYLARHPGDLAARVEIGERISWLLSGDLPATVLAALMVIFYGLLMICLDPGLASLVFFFAAAAWGMGRWGAPFRQDRAGQVAHENACLLGVTLGGLQMIETLKANGAESRFLQKWSMQQARVTGAQQRLAVSAECNSVSTRFLHSLGMLAVLGAGALRVMDGVMTVGTLVAYQSLVSGFFGPLAELAGFGGKLDETRAQVSRFQDVLDHPIEVPRLEGVETPSSGQVELRHVTYGYSSLKPAVLSDLSFKAPPGSRVAIVGRTGSGKSTVARLVAGLLTPWSGEILLDGKALKSLESSAIYSRVATVEQEIHLFSGTIAENLTLWNPSIQREALNRALQDACMDERVARLPGGLDARVIEGGRGFSGGERQRIEIARALARDPKILILDEATSALDADTEMRLYERLRLRGCTLLIIAHRLSAIRDSDEIIVLDQGRVVERGRHEDLWRGEGYYRQLILNE